MKRALPHAEHVGSLLRPAFLDAAKDDHVSGHLGSELLRFVEDVAVRRAVDRQVGAGFRVVTDGEARRHAWHEDFVFSLGGVRRGEESVVDFTNDSGETLPWVEYARVFDELASVDPNRPVFGDAFGFLTDRADEVRGDVLPKLSIPSPNHVHSSLSPAVNRTGESDEALSESIAAAYRSEVSGLYALGLRYLQLDDVSFSVFGDPRRRPSGDLDAAVGEHVDRVNAALGGAPDDLLTSLHVCRGNMRSSWALSGPYDAVAERLFSEARVDRFLLEFDDERSGGFEPLRHVRPGTSVVLGLVTTKRPALEDRDDLLRRIEEASRYVPVEDLALGTQCGFSSTEHGNLLTEDEEEAKLELVTSVASEVWGL